MSTQCCGHPMDGQRCDDCPLWIDEKIASIERQRDELAAIVDRAVKILYLAVPADQIVHTDSNNPITAWFADATKLLAKIEGDRK